MRVSPSNQHYTGDGAMIFKHICALGCEGIVSKRLGSAYITGIAIHPHGNMTRMYKPRECGFGFYIGGGGAEHTEIGEQAIVSKCLFRTRDRRE
jgi:hypothetical protein